MRTLSLLSALALSAALGACSDDGGSKPTSDTVVVTPDGPIITGDIMTGDGPGTTFDGGADQRITVPEGGGDMPAGGNCVADCTSQAPYLCVKDSTGTCVECNTDADCQGNPNGLGKTCDAAAGICLCAADADCAGNVWGSKCDPSMEFCSCVGDTDCTAPSKCTGTLYGTDVCATPCTVDANCTSSSYPKCDAASGKCVGCLGDADCTSASASKCDTTAGKCVA